ncbi:hypothetical protein M413DRAFT_258334 [Hebeloma cylindrosporum]|uniref:Uncharacterized protein n=1 Tax=Hebeloma cylindrosporum TaxID=76867 RepID=A0A0C3BLQ4_HEBCY|nr:hypothetical protein M413DRAFT_258334 [Hebeloma cylindrosporum h7]
MDFGLSAHHFFFFPVVPIFFSFFAPHTCPFDLLCTTLCCRFNLESRACSPCDVWDFFLLPTTYHYYYYMTCLYIHTYIFSGDLFVTYYLALGFFSVFFIDTTIHFFLLQMVVVLG